MTIILPKKDIKDWMAEYNPEALLADGFDEAIIGICERIGMEPVVAYDREKCLDILMNEFAEDSEDGEDLYMAAVEYFEYNVAGSYVGEATPVFITRFEEVAVSKVLFEQTEKGVWVYKNLTVVRNDAYNWKVYIENIMAENESVSEITVCEVPSILSLLILLGSFCDGETPTFSGAID